MKIRRHLMQLGCVLRGWQATESPVPAVHFAHSAIVIDIDVDDNSSEYAPMSGVF